MRRILITAALVAATITTAYASSNVRGHRAGWQGMDDRQR